MRITRKVDNDWSLATQRAAQPSQTNRRTLVSQTGSALRHDASRCVAILSLTVLLVIIAIVPVRLGFGQEQQRVVEITNVSHDPTREFYQDFNAVFAVETESL